MQWGLSNLENNACIKRCRLLFINKRLSVAVTDSRNTIVVTSSNTEIKVWELIDSYEYLEKVSIEIVKDETNLMALSEGGEFLAYTGKNKELTIVRISKEYV